MKSVDVLSGFESYNNACSLQMMQTKIFVEACERTVPLHSPMMGFG